jgi:hypothetical protein
MFLNKKRENLMAIGYNSRKKERKEVVLGWGRSSGLSIYNMYISVEEII